MLLMIYRFDFPGENVAIIQVYQKKINSCNYFSWSNFLSAGIVILLMTVKSLRMTGLSFLILIE